MTVVYIDSLFLLNAIINYLLLLAAARITGGVIFRLRLAASALLGGVYAVAIFFPGTDFLKTVPIKLAVGVLMALIAFGGARQLLRQTLVFFAVAAGFGGGVLAIGLLGGGGLTLHNGVFYSGMDLKVVLLSAALCYGVFSVVCRRMARHGWVTGEIVPAILTLAGRKITLSVLVDTGNTLTDPLTNRLVLVAEFDSIRPLLPQTTLTKEAVQNPIGTLERMKNQDGRFRLLPYKAVGVECGMLLALRVDQADIGGKVHKGMLVALAPNQLSDGGSYTALVGVA